MDIFALLTEQIPNQRSEIVQTIRTDYRNISLVTKNIGVNAVAYLGRKRKERVWARGGCHSLVEELKVEVILTSRRYSSPSCGAMPR